MQRGVREIETWLVRSMMVSARSDQFCSSQLISMNRNCLLLYVGLLLLLNKGKVTLCVLTLLFPLDLHCLLHLFPPLLLITVKILLSSLGQRNCISSFLYLFGSSSWSLLLSYMNVPLNLLWDNFSWFYFYNCLWYLVIKGF